MSKATFEGLKARNKALNKFVSNLSRVRDDYEDDEWQRGYNFAEIEIGNKLRQLMGSLPPGYNAPNPSLKTQAKERFLQWKRNQAQAEWKKLPKAEQERWEAYVAEGVEFGEIREREIAREIEFEVGDDVVLYCNIGYQGALYPSGSRGTLIGSGWDEIHEEVTFLVAFADQHLKPMYAHTYELRKVL